MDVAVVGAGVGRTGTHSLKIALEQLLGAPCHHMIEVLGDPTQIPAWIDAAEGRPVDWSAMLARYRAIVDWPGGRSGPNSRRHFPTRSCCCRSAIPKRGIAARRTRSS